MSNPAADFPEQIHTSTDVSGFSNSPLGGTTPTHIEVEGKQEQEIISAQQKLGSGASTPAKGLVLVGGNGGSSLWRKQSVFDVLDFGAVGDGVTDDTTAIQSALDAALPHGGIVVFGSFSYLISNPLRIPSYTVLDARGATITMVEHTGSGGVNTLQNYVVQSNRRLLDVTVASGDNTVTSAAGAFTSADIGKSIRIYYDYNTSTRKIEWLDTTISSINSPTSVEVANAPTISKTNRYACIGSRDKNITVIGGNWIRRSPNGAGGSSGWESNNLRFRHVDGLRVYQIVSDVEAGKYAISVGDCYDFIVDDVYMTHGYADCVHVNGPALWGTIRNVRSHGNGDDIISLTGGDFDNQMQHMGDTLGSITDVLIEDLFSEPSYNNSNGTQIGGISRGVLLLAGQDANNSAYWIDRISIQNVNTQLQNYPIFIGEDNQDSFTTGGRWGSILIDHVINNSASPPGGAVRVAANAHVEKLEVRSVVDIGAVTYLWIENGATVDTLFTLGIPTSFVAIDGTATVQHVIYNPPLLNQAQTFTAQQSFQDDTGGAEGIHTKHLKVFPKSVGGSASIFMDNLNGQIFEFYCNNGGSFGIFDNTNSKQPLTIDPNQPNDLLKLSSNTVFIGGGLNVQNDANLNGHYMYNVNQLNPSSDNTGAIGLSGYKYNEAYINNVHMAPAGSITPAANGELVIEKTSNTTITIKLKGSDGTVRSVALTLS